MKVWGEVPDSWGEKIHKAMQIEGWDTVSAYIRVQSREDLKQKGLLGVKSNLIDCNRDCKTLSDAEAV